MIEPKNIKLIWERASLYGEMGDNKRAIDSYEQILKVNYMYLCTMDACIHLWIAAIISQFLQLLPQNAGCRYVEITKELATVSKWLM